MMPEEIFNHQVWNILQSIKEESFTPDENGIFFYDITKTIIAPGENSPIQEKKIAIVHKLAREEKVVVIKKEILPDWRGTKSGFFLKLIQPKFEEIYKKFQKACDLQTYLNNFQEEGFKNLKNGKNIDQDFPKFSQIEQAEQIVRFSSNRIPEYALEELYKDEVQLISKLLGICNDQTKSVILKYPADLSNSDPDKAGFNNLATLQTLYMQHSVFKSFSEPLPKRVSRGDEIEAQIDFLKLKSYAEILHDEVESWKGNAFGIEEQKRRILEKLQGRFKKNPQEQYEYSEWLLGSYTPIGEDYPLGHSFSMPDLNRTDIRYQFMRAMRELEKDGHFNIVDVKIDFSATPQPTEASLYAHKWSLGERSLKFIPAKHCKVTIQPTTINSIIKSKIIPLPDDVEWKSEEEKYVLFFRDGRNLKFVNINKPTAKYFKLLMEYHGVEVKHKKTMECIENVTKDQIENLIKALRTKIKNAKLSSRISFTTDFKAGYTLHISKK